jgi:hypothetical protein
MRQREFIAGLGSVAAWPVAARAQQAAVPVIGYLGTGSPTDDDYKNITVPFLQGLKETGYVEGQNVAVEYRLVGGLVLHVIPMKPTTYVSYGAREGRRCGHGATYGATITLAR